jgi:phage-related minor tail protein
MMDRLVQSLAGVGVIRGLGVEMSEKAANFGALAIGAGAAAGSLFEFGEAWDHAQKAMLFQTGFGGAQLQGLMGSVEQLANVTPAAPGKIAAAMTSVVQSLHLSGDSLQTVTQQIADFDHFSGQAAVDVKGLGQVVRQFGVDGKDVPEMLDQLYTASIHTGIPLNELIKSLSEGGSALKSFGFSTGQAAGLMGELADAGIPLQHVLPALTHALGDAAKRGVDPVQFLKDTVTQIRDLVKVGKDADAQNLADKIFGSGRRGGGQDIFALIKAGETRLGCVD